MKKAQKTISTAQSIKREKITCIIGYLLVPLFFVLLYCLMFMSYEDLHQSYTEANMSSPEIIHNIYFYIPRIGEFFQHLAVHNMSLSVSLGLDIIFRLLTATLATTLIYFCTYFILGKKPSLKYKDLLIYLGCFLILMVSEVSEVFTFRFSYANNYIIAALITVTFLLPFRLKTQQTKKWQIFGMLLLGILFGMSTEIGPLAILAILFVWLIIKIIKKQFHFKTFLRQYKLQIIGIIGVLIGILIFYLGGGLKARTSGGYAEVYDYVSIFSIVKGDTFITIYKLWQHLWFNMRYLMFAPLIICIFILTESLIVKNNRKKDKKMPNHIFLYVTILAFCALYMGASCQIKVLDDMYPRYMFLVYVAIFMAVLAFINFLLDSFRLQEKPLRITNIVLIILSSVAIVDMSFAFVVYRIQIGDQLYKIQSNPGVGVFIKSSYNDVTMIPSPIFRFAQMTPFDWGNLGNGYMKYGYGPNPKQ